MSSHDVIARAQATSTRLEQLADVATRVGFDSRVAHQIAGLAIRTEKTTGLPAEDFIAGTLKACAAGSPVTRSQPFGRWVYPGRPESRAQRACNAVRDAVKLARRVLLRR